MVRTDTYIYTSPTGEKPLCSACAILLISGIEACPREGWTEDGNRGERETPTGKEQEREKTIGWDEEGEIRIGQDSMGV